MNISRTLVSASLGLIAGENNAMQLEHTLGGDEPWDYAENENETTAEKIARYKATIRHFEEEHGSDSEYDLEHVIR